MRTRDIALGVLRVGVGIAKNSVIRDGRLRITENHIRYGLYGPGPPDEPL